MVCTTLVVKAPRPTVDAIASRFSAYEIFEGARADLARMLVNTYTMPARGIEAAGLYEFRVNGNPEVFMAVERYATYFGVELARMTGAEAHVVYAETDYNLNAGEPGYLPLVSEEVMSPDYIANNSSAWDLTIGEALAMIKLYSYTHAARGILEAGVYGFMIDGNPEAILCAERYSDMSGIEWVRLSGNRIRARTFLIDYELNYAPPAGHASPGYMGFLIAE